MSSIRKTTGMGLQSSLFLSNLRNELDKMADTAHEVSDVAEGFFDQGYSPDDVRELLIIDGVDPDMASSCVRSFGRPIASKASDTSDSWGFTVKDAVGNTVTHKDLDIEITASSDAEATAKLEEIISTNLEADQTSGGLSPRTPMFIQTTTIPVSSQIVYPRERQ